MYKNLKKGGGKRTKTEREKDLVVVADLYRRGWTFKMIAEKVSAIRDYSISYVTVKHDFDLVLARWRKKHSAYLEHFIVSQVEQIAALKRECWKEYEKSKDPKRSIKETRKAVIKPSLRHRFKPDDLLDFQLEDIFGDNVREEKEELKKIDTIKNIDMQFTDLNKEFEEAGEIEINQTLEYTEKTGDAKYLELIRKLMDQESKLLGFTSGKEIKTTTNNTIIVSMPAPETQDIYLPGENNSDG
jgi:hypothetical protein